jgi:hypothetical protein
MDTRLTKPRRENPLEIAVRQQLEELKRMTVGQLRQKHVEVFGEESRSNHKQFLFRRIAWRIQALAEGGLSERARRRAMEIANDADLRIRAPKGAFQGSLAPELTTRRRVPADTDPRLPAPGTLLVRRYKDRDVIVKVLTEGFEFDGQIHRSLSAIARQVTGTKWNGYVFFNLESGAQHGQEYSFKAASECLGDEWACPDDPLRHLHAQVHRRRAPAGVQFPGCPAGSCRSVHREPEA